MPGIETIFWGWDSPLIDKAVEWLSRGARQGEALDLSDTVVVVPTAESSRRFREALATAASKRETAVMAPWVWHPEKCLMTEADRRRTATNAQTLLAWIRVMQEADLTRLPKLFPVVPERQSAAWAADLAHTMIDLQASLGAGGLTFADVAADEHAAVDRLRWNELAELERAFQKVIAARGLVASQQMKRERAESPVLPPEVKRICVIGVADAPPLFSRWLINAAGGCEVVVCVQAPAAKRAAFSATGQPLVSHWGERATVIVTLEESSLHVEADSAAQARKAAELMPTLLHRGRTAIGVCDAETSAHLLDRLQVEDVKAYEPGGRAAGQHGFIQLVRLWRDLVETESWKTFSSLLRLPDFAAALGFPSLQGVALLRMADDFADQRLPVDLRSAFDLLKTATESDATRWSSAQRAVEATLSMIGMFKRQPLPDAVRAWLVKLYGKHSFRPDHPQERELMKLTTSWIQTADALAGESSRMSARLSPTDALRLSIDMLADAKLSDPRGDIDLVIQGWLELLWEPAPHLVVLGCNEENLPGIFIAHPFLPDRLRESLGLPCQATRYARDAYLLHAMAAQREKGGTLHLLCGQWSERGDALRPSRLLFLCDDKRLPGRVSHLFPKDGVESATKQPPRTWLWRLKPRAVEAKADDTISVSRLNDYIACPFRYYLRRELRMDSVDATKAEMSAVEFGNLIHVAFKALADEVSMHVCLDEKEIAAFLTARARQEAEEIYGARLPFTVRLQLDSAIQRLGAAAAFEAAHRADGWRTIHAEMVLGDEQDAHPLMIGRRRLRGKIDRIDQRGNEVLILDFKTSETARAPEEAHLAKLSARVAGETEEWRTHTNADGKPCCWMDLQLPLYSRAWSMRHSGPISVGYFHLPTNVQETRISIWETLDQAALDSALQCAEEAVSRLERRIYWPPNDDVRFDDFADLFGGHAFEDVVDASEILKLEVTA